jgi:hypothetical protein
MDLLFQLCQHPLHGLASVQPFAGAKQATAQPGPVYQQALFCRIGKLLDPVFNRCIPEKGLL